MLAQRLVHVANKVLVRDIADHEAAFVQDAQDAFGLVLNQLADDAIVKELDICPGDAFRLILLLRFGGEGGQFGRV